MFLTVSLFENTTYGGMAPSSGYKGRNCVLCMVKIKKNVHKERCLFIIAVFHLLISTVERSMPSHLGLHFITLRAYMWSNKCSNTLKDAPNILL